MTILPPSTHEHDIAWAAQHAAFTETALVRDLPWGKLLALSSDQQRFWLKLVHRDTPSEKAALVGKLQAIQAALPDLTAPIIAADAARGAVLFADHGGASMSSDAGVEAAAALARAYAQAQVRADSALIDALPKLEAASLVDRLINMLQAVDRAPDGTAAAARFIGRREAQSYLWPILRCRDRLQALIAGAAAAPLTLCHCDLHAENAAFGPDGEILLLDWDEAKAGPAGLSLHGLLGGCAGAAALLAEPEDASSEDPRVRILNAYIDVLAEAGQAEPAPLIQALPGALTAGVIEHLLTFGAFPPLHDESTEAAARTMRGHLNDLLDLCDWLARNDSALQLDLAAYYAGVGGLERALPIVGALAGQAVGAEAFEAAAAAARNSSRSKDGLAVAQDIIATWNRAEKPEVAPSVQISEAEAADSEFLAAKQDLAVRLFQRYGVLVLENAFPRPLLEQCRALFLRKYDRYLFDRDHADALKVGDKRFMVSIDVEGPFNAPEIYAAPLLTPLLRRLLGEDMIIGALNVVASLPGAQDQWSHKDHPALFREAPVLETPEFGINVVIPLVDMDEEMGATCFVKGSHRLPNGAEEGWPRQLPYPKMGDCYLMSNRLTHFGMGNRSDRPRPILCMNYQRIWFRDIANHDKQAPVRISAETFAGLSDSHKGLFRWLFAP